MNKSTFDTLAAARELQAAGMQGDQADAVATAIGHSRGDQVTPADLAATADDLRADLAATATGLRADLAATADDLRADLAAMAADLRAEIAATAADLRADFRADLAAMAAELRAEIAALEARIARAMLVHSGVTIAATVGLLSLVITLAGNA